MKKRNGLTWAPGKNPFAWALTCLGIEPGIGDVCWLVELWLTGTYPVAIGVIGRRSRSSNIEPIRRPLA